MNRYYSTELPYSAELYHYGTPGMKWGKRKYQYEDGTLTPEGRKRYLKNPDVHHESSPKSGAQKAGEAVKNGAKVVGKTAAKGASRLGEGIERGVKTKLAEKMPFMLNDEELERYRERLKLENTYRDAMATKRRNIEAAKKPESYAQKLIKDVASNSVKTLASKATNKFADELFKSDDDRELEEYDRQIKRNNAEKANMEYDMINDVRRNNADRAIARTMRDSVEKANGAYNDANAEYLRVLADSSASDKEVKKAAKELKKAIKNKNKADRYSETISNIDERVANREADLKYRRANFDNYSTPQKNNMSKSRAEAILKEARRNGDTELNEEQIDALMTILYG